MSKQALSILTQAGLKLGVNWQKELSDLVHDISKRENIEHTEVLRSTDIQEVLASGKLSAPQKRAKIKKILTERRYPLYTLAKNEFAKQLKALKINPAIKVSHTPYFENEKLKIENSGNVGQEEFLAATQKLQEANLVRKAIKVAQDNC